MNLFELIKNLQDFRSMLENLGVTSGFLWGAGFLALFFFVLSTREVLGWYLRTNHLRDEVKAMRAQIREMQAILEKLNGENQSKAQAQKSEEPESSSSKFFKLTHWRNSL